MNITCLFKGHSWNHCTCTRCGKTRDEQHVVDHCEEKCSICGQIIHHDWVKKYEETIPYFEDRRLDEWVHRKAIQKALESYRVTNEHKAYLRTLR